ncbi:hypothetical protein Asp14428_07820 [Actinoplanes sp. NBRC 14428]|nr:hypothetical protein Asp14428_07820 [Actinoplanes sp. NBRC 14428]
MDGRHHDRCVVAAAADHATRLGTGLRIVQVLDVGGEPLIPATLPTVALRRTGERRDRLARARTRLRDRLAGLLGPAGPGADVRTAVGDPATVLLTYAREASLLVLGTRSGPPRTPFLLGTVSQDVAVHAACPVLLVPWHEDGDGRR